MKLSIIIPIYNVEKYLSIYIESILEQTYKDFELILVNDGSPDSCLEICKSYSKIDNRIKIIDKENGGLSSARNAGLDIAKGEYISFIDSDDFINKNMYTKMLEEIEKSNSDIIQCNFQEFEEESEIDRKNHKKSYIVSNRSEALDSLYGKQRVQTLVVWNKLYKRELWEDTRFPVGKIHEDVYTTHQILYKCSKVIFLNDSFYYYRQTPNSITNSKFTLKNFDKLEALKENIKFFEERNDSIYLNKSINSYVLALEDYYFKALRLTNGKVISKNLKKEFNKYFVKFIFSKHTELVSKVRVGIFYINPKCCMHLRNVIKCMKG